MSKEAITKGGPHKITASLSQECLLSNGDNGDRKLDGEIDLKFEYKFILSAKENAKIVVRSILLQMRLRCLMMTARTVWKWMAVVRLVRYEIAP